MDSAHAQFAANLRRHRDRAGLTQEELAAVCDLHRTEISLLECRRRSPRLKTLMALTGGLELSSPCELLEGIDG
jgi:transcriptional regulator with XRE-family HTH domain